MKASDSALAALADLLEYPAGKRDVVADARRARLLLEAQAPRAAARVGTFADGMEAIGPDEREELYTRTFDINPLCCLEVGWQIHGESYDRGDTLVRLRALLRDHEIPETTELPDHLSQVLRILSVLGEPGEMASTLVAPAITKMRSGFDDARDNPYATLLDAVWEALHEMIPAENEETIHV